MRLIIRYSLGIFLLPVFGLLPALPAWGQAVTLRYGHTAGTTLSYHLTLDTPNLQASQKIIVDIVRKVATINAQEVMKINTSMNNGQMIINGISHPLPVQGQVLSAMVNRRGEVLETTATGQLADLFSQAGISTASMSPDIFRALGILEFPDAAVAEGDSWSVDKNHTLADGETLNVTYSYTLSGFVDCAQSQAQCAQISIAAQPQISMYQDLPSLRRGMQMNGQIHISGTLLFATAEGRIVQLDETVESNAVAIATGYDGLAQVVPVYQKTTISLLLQ